MKLLQESYLDKIKVIYIDPPYNTGNDFIYNDSFSKKKSDYISENNQFDNQGNRLFVNSETNGRFHTDWLNMIYPRLKLAKNLLSSEGVLFVSVDDNELDNLKHICDEIFGKDNFRNRLLVRRRIKSINVQFADNGLNSFNVGYEYILVYSKTSSFLFKPLRMKKQNVPQKGTWNVFWSNADRPTMRYEILGFTPSTGQWRWQKNVADEAIENYKKFLKNASDKMSLEEYWNNNGQKMKFIRRIPDGYGKNGGVQYWVGPSDTSLRTSNWTDIEVSQIAKEYNIPFSNPKNVDLIETILSSVYGNDFFVLDFFSGSGTTADAVMRLNVKDSGSRKYIMVQIPETINDTTTDANEYFTICDIGEERIRRASEKIHKEYPDVCFDDGFRILKLSSSNMKYVYYNPKETTQDSFSSMVDNIKEDRTPMDLLFQVMLDLGVLLSSKIKTFDIEGKQMFDVADGYLIACFDKDITADIIIDIAKRKPYYAVFRDASLADDSVATNFDQIFETYSKDTIRRVL